MLDHVQIKPTRHPDDWLERALSLARRRSRDVSFGRDRGGAPRPQAWLIPDIAASAQVLLADRLFGDLDDVESEGLLAFIRSNQMPDGTWANDRGEPDLSLTVLGWWSRVQCGDDPTSTDLLAAQRAVLEMGGAQRASFEVRLWLALSGTVDWNWLPAIPGELWLLPGQHPLAAERISGWAFEVVTAFHLLSSANVRLHLKDPSALLLRDHQKRAIAPRLTKPGLAGDVLLSLDRLIRISRHLPRSFLRRKSREAAQRQLLQRQQESGAWFSTIPTIFSLLALRGCGYTTDAPPLRRGLDALRLARGVFARDVSGTESRWVIQGLHGQPWVETVESAVSLAGSSDISPLLQAIIAGQVSEDGPWQRRANAPRGGWPIDRASSRHLDVWSTARIVDLLSRHVPLAQREFALEQALRKAGQAMLAMQESDGSFARFERGESSVIFANLPWEDADHLRRDPAEDPNRTRITAAVLIALARLGMERRDDRIARALEWLQRQANATAPLDISTLIEITLAWAAFHPADDPLRQSLTSRLRASQREDGSFGSAAQSAQALLALLELSNDRSCVQAIRAGRWLARMLDAPETVRFHRAPGIGLCAVQEDPHADLRQTCIALEALAKARGCAAGQP
jgi:squalene-hopene/tetraprenyl-beta-curcumene cyclase